LSEFPVKERHGIRGVLCDIDDTLTTDGRLTAEAFSALERLQAAGLSVIPITGRPAGWCDHIARMWPVAAVVGENGAFYFLYDRGKRAMRRGYADGAAARAAHRERLAAIGREIVEAVPGCAIAADQSYRETDLAIDYREDVAPLGRDAVDRIVALMQASARTTSSP
jgi:HAD superfamily hydrolase (TIGR01484 family)